MAKRSSRKKQKVSAPLDQQAAATRTTKAPSRGTWKIMDRGSSVVAGLAAARVSAVAWRVVTGRRPPNSGRHPDVSTREAVAWAVVGGGLIELVKVSVRRGAATYWVRSTGQLPPGMKPLTTPAAAKKAAGTTKEPVLAEPAPHTSTRKRVSRRSRGR